MSDQETCVKPLRMFRPGCGRGVEKCGKPAVDGVTISFGGQSTRVAWCAEHEPRIRLTEHERPGSIHPVG